MPKGLILKYWNYMLGGRSNMWRNAVESLTQNAMGIWVTW